MTRPIDADALKGEKFYSHERHEYCVSVYAIDTMPTIEPDRPHGEWIPCSERLPDESGKYMVCWCGDWGVDICIAEYSKSGKYWLHREGCEIRGINAWMPLPEPYKGGGEVE